MVDVQTAGGDNQGQREYWSSVTGKNWIEYEDRLDQLMQSVNDRLLERTRPGPGMRMLDIGCGTGATSIDFATQIGPEGRVVSVDISEPMLERAEDRAAQAGLDCLNFVLADAQIHDFATDQFDLVVSRFGVMFFADPVQAFTNIRRSMRAGGKLCIACWAPAAGNPWFHVARDAAIARLGQPASVPPNSPGPLGFADTAFVLSVLKRAGFSDCRAEPEIVDLCLPGDIEAAASFATNLGPAMRIIKELGGGGDDLKAITAEIAKGLARFHVDGGLIIPAKIWFYTATNS